MSYHFRYTADIQVERIEGKFVSREEIADLILEALEQANPETLDGLGTDGGSSYEITDWAIDEMPIERPKKAKKLS